jgi:glyoxylase-like metal-dependent hydrolase (beta-lactamase superfamily II)
MPAASDLHQVSPALFVWHDYSQDARTELFSSALATPSGVYLFDPIPLAAEPLALLSDVASVAGIIVTNSNHHRATLDYAEKFSVPIFAHSHSFPENRPKRLVEVADGGKIGGEFEVIAIEGAAAGEIVLFHPRDGGTLIVGDALINFEPYGFTSLPRKYCANEKEMRRSLQKVLACKAERLVFAHGTPILIGASARLQQLLEVDLRSAR